MYVIQQGFTNSKGQYFSNIRNIHFNQYSDVFGSFGKHLNESHKDSPNDFDINNEGVNIYQSKYCENIALKLYKDIGSYKYTFHDDEVIISELQKRQKNIKLTKFPTGVITVENKVVGQEIPYFSNSINIAKLFESGKLTKRPTQYYLEILKILKELLENGILYQDIHGGNFIIDSNGNVQVIDFQPGLVSFDENIKYNDSISFYNLKNSLIN